jgi:signal transduction histidine kinase
MRLGIRAKQVLGVTCIVGIVVVVLSALNAMRLASVILHESDNRGQVLSKAIFHRARELVTTGVADPYAGLRTDPGLRALLQASLYGEGITVASIVDRAGVVVASSDPSLVGQRPTPPVDLSALLSDTPVNQVQAVYRGVGTVEVRQPMILGDELFGAIRVEVSMALMKRELVSSLYPSLVTAVVALGVAVLVAGLLSQLLLRPIHMLRGGLTRLGQGEFGVTLDLPEGDEFGELGSFFNTVSQQLSADRTRMAGQQAHLQTAVEHLEDAVALFNPSGELLFSNPAMEHALPSSAVGRAVAALLPSGHPYRSLVEETLATRQSRGPVQVSLPSVDQDGKEQDQQASLLMTHVIAGTGGEIVAVLLVERDVAYLSRVHSMLAYSRKLVALGRLTAGIAHEVKNPLNAMMIHLELLRGKIKKLASAAVAEPQVLAAAAGGSTLGLTQTAQALPAPAQGALQHVEVIEGEIRRLDEVVQGFLRFTRPEDLKLQPVRVGALMNDIQPLIEAEARKNNVRLLFDCPASAPAVNGDSAMLRQVFLNLAINACQAMPNGGALRLTCAATSKQRIEVRVEDTGVGIAPEHLGKIFDLYFTTKDSGTGIGLSMVYRIVQLHDGEIEVQSTPGRGTIFRVLLPRAID